MSDDAPNLSDPTLYLNRELSALAFNRRVLELVGDAQLPPLERLRLLTIVSANLDKFFEIRVAGLKEQQEYGLPHAAADALTPVQTLQHIGAAAHELVAAQYRALDDVVVPDLDRAGVRILRRGQWNDRQRRWLRAYFRDEILPVLTPIGLDPAHPFPRIANMSLNFIVRLRGEDAFGRHDGTAVVQVPRGLPRIVALPKRTGGGDNAFVPLRSIIRANIGELFLGMEVESCHQFRVTRNSELFVDEEEVSDLMQAVKGELRRRRFGDAVRLELAHDAADATADFLLQRFALSRDDLYRVNGPVNLHRLGAVYDMARDATALKHPHFVPSVPPGLEEGADIFAAIRAGTILLHHPYQSFAPVTELVQRAADDPDVLGITMALYRTQDRSPIVQGLFNAARAGKDVTAVVELRARFDEAQNIDLASALQAAGARVSFGVAGHKAHAKMFMIVRQEDGKLRRYVHIGTGNYHTENAQTYTDISLLTCDEAITDDVHQLFLQMTGIGKATRLRKAMQAPFGLETALLKLIAREAGNARAGKEARIIAKMNALTAPSLIRALYEASQAGVRIDLVVRGMCCLRPGVHGVSHNIRVRCVLGRFLEHARVFWFSAGGKGKTFISSADWMERNLHRRVDVSIPVEDAGLRRRLMDEVLTPSLNDTACAWELGSDGEYRRVAGGDTPYSSQNDLLKRLATTK